MLRVSLAHCQERPLHSGDKIFAPMKQSSQAFALRINTILRALFFLLASSIAITKIASADPPCADALAQHAVCAAANDEAARLIAARHLAGAIVVQDVRTGALVAFASVSAPPDSTAKNLDIDVTSPLLPLSLTKVLLAASWWDHERQIASAHRAAPIDVHEMLVTGSDSAGRLLANALRAAVGSQVALDDLNRFGFPPCPTDDAQKIDTSFWQTLTPQWQARLIPAAPCTNLSPDTGTSEWASALSIGESSFSVTLLHLSRFMQAIGNRGILLQPAARDTASAAPSANQSSSAKKIMEASTASKLESAMIDNVERGTAKGVRGRLGPKWMMGGKTGTGPADANPFDGCFAGLLFDDRRQARYTVVAYIKRGGLGGGAAAEISADLFKSILGLQRGP